MSAPVRVAVVRPKLTGAKAVGRLIGTLANIALTGWILMLIAGTITPWHPSYWYATLAVIAFREVQLGSGWTYWTHDAAATR